MEQTIATKRRRNIGKSVTAKTRACLRPDVPRRQREDPIMIPAPFILPLHPLSLFSPFFPIAFPTFPPENERTRKEQKKQKRKLLAGEIAITVPEAENGGRQEVQHGEFGVVSSSRKAKEPKGRNIHRY